jgi:hypothetical protein
LGKEKSNNKPFGFGNTSRRFPQVGIRAQGKIAKDHFAFDQAMQGNDCQKIRRGGDFIVQQRDFFGEKIGKSTVVDVKSGGLGLTEAQEKRRQQLGRNRHKIIRY